MARFFCRPGEDLTGKKIQDVMFCSSYGSASKPVCGEGKKCKMCPFHNAITAALSNLRQGASLSYPFHHLTDNTEAHFILSSNCLKISEKKFCLLSMEDVTQLKNVEEQSERLKRMSALGNLAGRIAHDLNNICTVILGNVTLSHLSKKIDDSMTEIMDNIEEATLRAADLGQELLTFARGGAPCVKNVDLQTMITELSDKIVAEHHVPLNTDVPDDLWPILGEEEQIHTACRNILQNAAEALTEKDLADEKNGSSGITHSKQLGISFSATNRTVKTGELFAVKPGRYVELVISDNGIGIAADEVDQMIIPFYSKKKGREGLGLSAAWSIIDRHKGNFSISPNIDGGTTVSMLIPAGIDMESTGKRLQDNIRKQPVKPQKINIASLPEKVETGGKILFMDDNKILRVATGEVLKYLGWTVVEASDGEEAIDAYREALMSKTPFDVVILDLTVPEGMGGLETIIQLLKINPKVKAIVSSGYHHDPIMANFWEYGFSDCVKKPYMAAKLNASIQRLVEKDV
jgi:signal transduction histidine kinase/ActR/RegA family two-component response regulator